MSSLGQTRFMNALTRLDEEGALEKSILISAASLRILGIRVYTYFIDLLVQRSYYTKKSEEMSFTPRYELEPLSLKLADFSLRMGTVEGDTCSFRHLVKPYNVYEEVEFRLGGQVKPVKIRPHDYVRKDGEEAIQRMVQRYDKGYWQDFYSYHKQIEAIDLGMRAKELNFGPQKQLRLED
jgi:hypothetical protein